MKSTPLFQPERFQLDESAGYLVARVRTTFAHALDQVLEKEGITCAQGGIFLLLEEGKCTTAAELSRHIYIDSAALKRTLDKMEEAGMVQRIPNPDDRRQFKLRLTSTGHALAKRLPALYSKVMEHYFQGFSREEVEFLKFLLRKILANRPDSAENNKLLSQ